MKKVLTIYAHPEPTSLTRQLVQVTFETLERQGHEGPPRRVPQGAPTALTPGGAGAGLQCHGARYLRSGHTNPRKSQQDATPADSRPDRLSPTRG